MITRSQSRNPHQSHDLPQSRPHPPPSAARRGRPRLTCAEGAITCVEALSNGKATQKQIPLTFGQAFRPGDVPKGQILVARDGNTAIPLQIDETATHSDGSLRFAVLSLTLPHLATGERRTVSFFRQSGAGYATANAAGRPELPELNFSVRLYSTQVTQIGFGHRNGTRDGPGFEVGERITLNVHADSGPPETFTHTVAPDQAGNQVGALTKLADAFAKRINEESRRFRADRIGQAGGYEKLWLSTQQPDGGAFRLQIPPQIANRIGVATLRPYQPPRQFSGNTLSAFEQAWQRGVRARLNGPVAREYAFAIPLVERAGGKPHPQLVARLHSRIYTNHAVRTDIVLENNWAYEPGPGNLDYDLSITHQGKEVLTQARFVHYHHARWHRVIWTGSPAPEVALRHHMPYFLASKAVWNYDLNLPINDTALDNETRSLSKADTGPMGNALLTHEFGTTGGRAEIGPLPRWAALYLITQDPRPLKSMLANADAAAAVPIHYRDAATDLPVSLERHPGMAARADWADSRDRFPPVSYGETPWRPDISHQGSFAYLPYLLTGDLFYLEEMQFWAAYNVIAIPPARRNYADGLLVVEQIRGQAWGLRSLGQAAWATPDQHPLKPYFQQRLRNNLAWYVDRYTSGKHSDISPLGCIIQGDHPDITAPWQNDFVMLVMAQLADQGEPLAARYLSWLGRCTVGRWTAESEGFCRFKAAAYWPAIRDQGRLLGTWGEVFRKNWPDIKTCQPAQPLDGYPGSPSGYVAYARAMLAVARDHGLTGAASALEWLDKTTPETLRAMSNDPTWAIVPRQEKTP